MRERRVSESQDQRPLGFVTRKRKALGVITERERSKGSGMGSARLE